MSQPQDLRPYQRECIVAVKSAWAKRDENNRIIRAACDLCTGAGKTTILAQLIRESIDFNTQRVLVIAHVSEIIQQLRDRIKQQFAELPVWVKANGKLVPGVGIVMAEQNEYTARVVVATRQSLNKTRLDQVLSAGKIDVLVVDEAHHDQLNTYATIENALRELNPDLRKVGFSATWNRTDKKPLAASYDQIVYQFGVLDAIRDGFLVPPTRLRVSTGIDTSKIKTQSGDYNQHELKSVLEAGNWAELAVKAYLDYVAPTRKHTVAFLQNVAFSQFFVSKLNEAGISAAHIDGETPKQTRREIIRDFSQGLIRVVSNYGVITEGTDMPIVDSILWARPTRSQTVLTQAVGRGLRPNFGKLDCLVLDLTVTDTKAAPAGTLAGKMEHCKKCKCEFYSGYPQCPQCGWVLEKDEEPEPSSKPDPARRIEEIFKSQLNPTMQGLSVREVSMFDEMNTAWWRGENGVMTVSAGFEGTLAIMPPTYADVERQKERLDAGEKLLATIPDNQLPSLRRNIEYLRREIDRAEGYTLYFVPNNKVRGEWLPKDQQKPIQQLRSNSDLASLLRDADLEAAHRGGKDAMIGVDWRKQPASPAQISLLQKFGKEIPEGMTKGDAGRWLDFCFTIPKVEQFIKADYLPELQREKAS